MFDVNFSKHTSNCGVYEIVKLYEDLPDGAKYQLNIRGSFYATGSLKHLKETARFDKYRR